VAAAVSALIAYVPAFAGWRLLLGHGVLLGVAGLTWFGHGGRLVFAVMTLVFVASAAAVLAHGFAAPRLAVTAMPGSPARRIGCHGDPLVVPGGDRTRYGHRGAGSASLASEAPTIAVASPGRPSS
jgi:hypothetical protein